MSPFIQSSGPFKSLVPADWFQRPEDSSIWLRLYTSLITPPDQLIQVIEAWSTSQDGEDRMLSFAGPIMFGAGTVADLRVPFAHFQLYSPSTGGVVLEVHLSERALPRTGYVFLGTPFRRDGGNGDEPEARRILDVAAGLICVHTGLNFMRECSFEGEVRGRDGTTAVPSQPRKIPQPPEGPFLNAQNGTDISEISEALSRMKQPQRGRLELSLRLMDAAMRKDEGFFEYWSAFEVVCDGKSGRIKDRVARIRGIKSHAEAARQAGLDVLTRWRGDYVHKGLTPFLTSDVERYLQLVFLDLLRHELSLPPRNHAFGLQHAIGIDLSPLGLADNRTEAQKQARDEAIAAAAQASQVPATESD